MNLQEHISQEELNDLLNAHPTIEESKECIKTKIAKVVANNVQVGTSVASQCSIIEAVTDDISELFKKTK